MNGGELSGDLALIVDLCGPKITATKWATDFAAIEISLSGRCALLATLHGTRHTAHSEMLTVSAL